MTTTPTTNRIIRLGTVLDRTGLSRSTVYRKMEEGTFPRQLKIGTRCAGWREHEVEDWLRNPMCYEASSSATDREAPNTVSAR